MCCFSRPVPYVANTRIFARGVDGGRQVLVYQMRVEIPEDLAMVMPLPVPPSPADDAVAFIDLQGYADFFDDLALAFPPMFQPASRSFGLDLAVHEKPKLVVHDVGQFEASFVPARADFVRLDERFRLPEGVWDALPQYDDYGFAVFKLKPEKRLLGLESERLRIHPMAFSFPTREPSALFFPTVHVHDGTAPTEAGFDHTLVCQAGGVLGALLDWTASGGPLGRHLDGERARGTVDPAAPGFSTALVGSLPNQDTWLRPPPGVDLADLSPSGPAFRVRIRGRTPNERLPAVIDALSRGLAELTANRRDRWQLTNVRDDLPTFFINGNQLWTGTSHMTGRRASDTGGPGLVRFTAFTDGVGPQDVHLAFAAVPDDARVAEIQAALRHLLDRALA